MRADTWKPLFLSALRNSGNIRASCQAAGVTRQAAYKARERSQEFASQWDEALEEAIDTLEAAAWTRARDGVVRRDPIMYQGQKVGEKVIVEYSDTVLIQLLKAHRPEKYRERFDVQIKEVQARAETAIQECMQRTGKDRAGAIELLKPYIPEISNLVH
jgi:N-methylhydantoinase A/oxoprolinase/acetone carboxylase beta subunit